MDLGSLGWVEVVGIAGRGLEKEMRISHGICSGIGDYSRLLVD
jgi:hypothetical protein